MSEEVCRTLFEGNEDDRKLAASINATMPNAACELYSVSAESPGPVQHGEELIRLAISPRDFDEETGELALSPFEKVFEQGLSVLREGASDEDCIGQAFEILPHQAAEPHKEIRGISIAKAGAVRELRREDQRLFAVYDQVVPRFRNKEDPPISSHVGIFAIVIPKGAVPKGELPSNQVKKDIARKIYSLFTDGRIKVADFRASLFEDLNIRARDRAFEIKAQPDSIE